MYNDLNFRSLIVGANTSIPLANGEFTTDINFDNAATTPPFVSVLNSINNFAPWYSSIHRGAGYKSKYSSEIYESAREVVASFVKADINNDSIVFVKNTTEAINKLSFRLYRKFKDYIILSTDMEHHSNDLPWRGKYKIDYVPINSSGKLSLTDLEIKLRKYKGDVKLVTVTGASNVTGCKNPIHTIAALAHKYKAKILVDGAQLVPHSPVNMMPASSSEHIDFLVFSAHKMYAPFGTGVLIAPKEYLENGPPEYSGGGTIELVTHEHIRWAKPPARDEAGTPNIMGVVALTEAIKTLNSIGMSNIEEYEKSLTKYAVQKLKDIDDIEFYGNSQNCNDKVSILPFNIKCLPHQITATALAFEFGIAVRSGCFCAQPYVQKLLDIPSKQIRKYLKNPNIPRPGMVRISFGLYNNFQEIDILYDALKLIVKNKEHYSKKYSFALNQPE